MESQPTHLLKREMVKVNNKDLILDESKTFTLLQWNTLARCYSIDWHHPKCPKEKLFFENRMPLIAQEIKSFDADFVCLQEVDQRDLDFFVKDCTGEDYGFSFVKKNQSYDGSLFFWKKNRFTHLQAKEVLHYSNKAKQKLANQKSQINVVLQKTQSKKEHIIISGVSHFKAGPFFRGDRKIQALQMAEELEATRLQYLERYPKATIHIVTCGDFNDTQTSSPVTVFTGKDAKPQLTGENGYDTLTIDHAFPLLFGLTFSYQGVIDFILHSKNLAVVEYLESPSKENIGKNSVPHIHYPSDHLDLVRKFQMLE